MERQARLREALPLSNAGCGYWSALRARMLATLLYEDPSAGLHEDAPARLREHPVLLGCSILRRPSPPSSVGGHHDPAGGYEEGHRGHHRERPDFRDTALRVTCRTPILRGP